jgi:hypothetical protein
MKRKALDLDTVKAARMEKSNKCAADLMRRKLAVVLTFVLALQGLRSFLVVPLSPYICLDTSALIDHDAAAAHEHHHEAVLPLRSKSDSGSSFEHCKDDQPGTLSTPAQPYAINSYEFVASPNEQISSAARCGPAYRDFLPAPPTEPPRA